MFLKCASKKWYAGSPFILRWHCNPSNISKTLEGLKIQCNNPGSVWKKKSVNKIYLIIHIYKNVLKCIRSIKKFLEKVKYDLHTMQQLRIRGRCHLEQLQTNVHAHVCVQSLIKVLCRQKYC